MTPVFADAGCFADLAEVLARPLEAAKLNEMACVDALGFILGTAIARQLAVGIIPAREGSKLPVTSESEAFRHSSG